MRPYPCARTGPLARVSSFRFSSAFGGRRRRRPRGTLAPARRHPPVRSLSPRRTARITRARVAVAAHGVVYDDDDDDVPAAGARGAPRVAPLGAAPSRPARVEKRARDGVRDHGFGRGRG